VPFSSSPPYPTYTTSDGTYISYVGDMAHGGELYYPSGAKYDINLVNNRLLVTKFQLLHKAKLLLERLARPGRQCSGRPGISRGNQAAHHPVKNKVYTDGALKACLKQGGDGGQA